MLYIEATRIRRARDLLLRSDRRISDIAHEVGFENAFHFSTRFRKATGQSPREFRRRPKVAR
jgi:AraC-like DNA-binding protein